MMEKIRKLKNQKGFTLVELIVVLVILAILAALLVPALTGYIDRAKEKDIIAQTRQVVMAAQTLADEAYATQAKGSEAISFVEKAEEGETQPTVTYDSVIALAEVKGSITSVTMDTTNKGKIAALVYTNGGLTCTYTAANANQYEVKSATATS